MDYIQYMKMTKLVLHQQICSRVDGCKIKLPEVCYIADCLIVRKAEVYL